MGFALRIAHGNRMRREVVKPRDWRVNSGWIKALPLFCVVSVRSSHTSIPSVKSTGRTLPKGRPVRPNRCCSLSTVYCLLSQHFRDRVADDADEAVGFVGGEDEGRGDRDAGIRAADDQAPLARRRL